MDGAIVFRVPKNIRRFLASRAAAAKLANGNWRHFESEFLNAVFTIVFLDPENLGLDILQAIF